MICCKRTTRMFVAECSKLAATTLCGVFQSLSSALYGCATHPSCMVVLEAPMCSWLTVGTCNYRFEKLTMDCGPNRVLNLQALP